MLVSGSVVVIDGSYSCFHLVSKSFYKTRNPPGEQGWYDISAPHLQIVQTHFLDGISTKQHKIHGDSCQKKLESKNMVCWNYIPFKRGGLTNVSSKSLFFFVQNPPTGHAATWAVISWALSGCGFWYTQIYWGPRIIAGHYIHQAALGIFYEGSPIVGPSSQKASDTIPILQGILMGVVQEMELRVSFLLLKCWLTHRLGQIKWISNTLKLTILLPTFDHQIGQNLGLNSQLVKKSLHLKIG